MANFIFTGIPVIPKNEEKFCREWSANGKEFISLNFGIKAGTSIAYVELFGFTNPELNVRTNEEGNKFNYEKVKWEDRFDNEILSKAHRNSYFMLEAEHNGIRKKYLSSYDFALAIKEHILANPDKKIRVVGSVEKQPYVNDKNIGSIYTKYIISNVYSPADDAPMKLTINYEFYYNKESIDKDSFKDNKKIYINGLTKEWYADRNSTTRYIKNTGYRKGDNSIGQTVYVPQQFVLNASKLDLDNEQHKNRFDFMVNSIDKAKSSKKMYKAFWECSLVAGAEEVPFDKEQLTENQLAQVELGLASIDEFRPKGEIYGNRIDEVRLVKEILKGNFIDGVVELEDDIELFEKYKLQFAKNETLEDLMKEEEKIVPAVEDLFN